jgi:hypothetical protein
MTNEIYHSQFCPFQADDIVADCILSEMVRMRPSIFREIASMRIDKNRTVEIVFYLKDNLIEVGLSVYK